MLSCQTTPTFNRHPSLSSPICLNSDLVYYLPAYSKMHQPSVICPFLLLFGLLLPVLGRRMTTHHLPTGIDWEQPTIPDQPSLFTLPSQRPSFLLSVDTGLPPSPSSTSATAHTPVTPVSAPSNIISLAMGLTSILVSVVAFVDQRLSRKNTPPPTTVTTSGLGEEMEKRIQQLEKNSQEMAKVADAFKRLLEGRNGTLPVRKKSSQQSRSLNEDSAYNTPKRSKTTFRRPSTTRSQSPSMLQNSPQHTTGTDVGTRKKPPRSRSGRSGSKNSPKS